MPKSTRTPEEIRRARAEGGKKAYSKVKPKTPPQPCQRCGKERAHHDGLDICIRCEAAERRRGNPDKRAQTRESVAKYRAAKKSASTVDKSHGRSRTRKQMGLPPEPQERALKPQPADVIAAKETAASLTSRERRQLTVAEATHIEFARRELARRKLIHFILRRNPKYLAGWVHEDICERLERFSADVAAGKSPRLMLFMPPRHGKSEICSRNFPAWHLGNYPDHQIIATSYSAPLAYDFSRKVQEIVEDADFELLFETRLKADARSIEAWQTSADGMYVAAGVGGPVTGRGAHVALIDDPLKNREEADSPSHRQLIKDWYTSTLYTRLMPGGGILIIQTRWHDDDLSGWLISIMQEAEKQAAEEGAWPDDADKWEIVSYPAIAKHDEKHRKQGEALHPERYPLSALLKIKRSVQGDWEPLYQQNPIPDEGAFFTTDMIRYYDGAAPAGISIIAAGDLAISKADYANHTVFIAAGVDEKDDLYVLDARRGRWDSDEIINELISLYRQWRPQLIGLEQTHVEKAIGPFLEKRIREEKLWSMAIESLPPGKRDKSLRAQPIRGRMKQGKVFFPKNAPWMEWLLRELLRFPGSAQDDGVDTMAWLGQMLNMVQYTPPPKPKLKSWKDRLNAIASGITNKLKNPAMAA